METLTVWYEYPKGSGIMHPRTYTGFGPLYYTEDDE